MRPSCWHLAHLAFSWGFLRSFFLSKPLGLCICRWNLKQLDYHLAKISITDQFMSFSPSLAVATLLCKFEPGVGRKPSSQTLKTLELSEIFDTFLRLKVYDFNKIFITCYLTIAYRLCRLLWSVSMRQSIYYKLRSFSKRRVF